MAHRERASGERYSSGVQLRQGCVEEFPEAADNMETVGQVEGLCGRHRGVCQRGNQEETGRTSELLEGETRQWMLDNEMVLNEGKEQVLEVGMARKPEQNAESKQQEAGETRKRRPGVNDLVMDHRVANMPKRTQITRQEQAYAVLENVAMLECAANTKLEVTGAAGLQRAHYGCEVDYIPQPALVIMRRKIKKAVWGDKSTRNAAAAIVPESPGKDPEVHRNVRGIANWRRCLREEVPEGLREYWRTCVGAGRLIKGPIHQVRRIVESRGFTANEYDRWEREEK